MNTFEIGQIMRSLFLGLFVVLSVSSSVYAQNTTVIEKKDERKIVASDLIPRAVPVLSLVEAQKANELALREYETRMDILRKQKIRRFIICFICSLAGIILSLSCVNLYRKKKLKSAVLFLYKSLFGKMFYCTRFCRWDWGAILLVFLVTFFFSLLAGHRAMMKGYIGTRWYPHFVAMTALSFYNDAGMEVPSYSAESKLADFIGKGSKGNIAFSDISKEDSIPPRYLKPERSSNITAYFCSPGLPWLVSLWWKLIGNPNWSTLHILFCIIYALIAVSAYCALRQVTGLIPSVILGMMFSLYPSAMNEGVFSPRDAGRALTCFIAITLLLSLSKKCFSWKKVALSSMFLLFICATYTIFRNDFVVFVPFIVIATLFCHGSISKNLLKKIIIIFSIVLGFLIAFSFPRYQGRYAFNHVLFIGLADYPYMNDLHFSSDNYSKGIAYTDFYGWIMTPAKKYREQGTINLEWYSKEYDQAMNKELMSLFYLYPFDFLRFALSSSLQSITSGSRLSDRALPYIESAPGYLFYRILSVDVYHSIPMWLWYTILLGALLLLLGGCFYRNLLFVCSIVLLSGSYLFQFDIRHYFYLMIVLLLALGFVLNRIIRFFMLLVWNRRRVLSICLYNTKYFLIHCSVFAVIVILSVSTLAMAYSVQKGQIEKEIRIFDLSSKESLDFQEEKGDSIMQKGTEGTEIILPGFYDKCLSEAAPNQKYISIFLEVKFFVETDEYKEKIVVLPRYENTSDFNLRPNVTAAEVINATFTCPIPMTFYAKKGQNTLYLPVYLTRGKAPFVGIEFLCKGNHIDITSVKKIIDTKKIHTQSAFLVPDQRSEMQYAGNMDWNRVFWGNKK